MRNGFFTTEETQNIRQKKSKLPSCAICKLKHKCVSPMMKPEGKGLEGILIITESPGEKSDAVGKQLLGFSGDLVRREFERNGIDVERDCIVINAVPCQPPKGRTPSDSEIEACRTKLLEEVKKIQPHLIILLGGGAIKSLIGSVWTKDNKFGASLWRGFRIPDQKFKAWICPTLSPGYVLRQKNMFKGKGLAPAEFSFRQDVEKALEKLEEDVPDYGQPSDGVKILSPAMAIDVLGKLVDGPARQVAFDYETTGLKPQNPKQEIVTAAISYNPWEAFAFSMDTGDEELIDVWIEFLEAKNLTKIGANIKYEETWGRTIYGAETSPWGFDTTIGAHVLDNRSGITSLKFQTYVRFGFAGYDQDVEPYLKGGGSNQINRIKKAPRKKVLLYNGMDALFTLPMAQEMMEEMNEG